MSSKRYHDWYRSCVVRECKNTSVKTPEKLWIRVPREINKRTAWLKLAKRDPDSISTKSGVHFCEDHFDMPNEMENYMQYHIMGKVKKIRMKEGCIPSKFECQNVKTKRKSGEKSRKEKHEDIKLRKEIVSKCLKEHEQSCGPSTSNSKPVICEDIKEETESETETDICEDTENLSESLIWDVNVTDHEANQDEIVDPLPHFDSESVCRCCLSDARSLRALGHSQRWVGAALCASARVCWECAATLRRMQSFRDRARTAQDLLTQAEHTQITSEIKSLSTLTRCFKDTYDYVFEHEYSNEPIPHERQKEYSEIKVQRSEFVDIHPFFDIKVEIEEVKTEMHNDHSNNRTVVSEGPHVQTTADDERKVLRNDGNEETIKPAEETIKSAEETTKPAKKRIKPAKETIKTAEKTRKQAKKRIKPAEETIKTAEKRTKPAEVTKKSAEVTIKPTEEAIKRRGGCTTLPAAKPYKYANPVYSECGICHEKVTTSMKVHLTSHHSPAELPKCLDCDKQFKTQRFYTFHRINVHVPRKYRCQFCGRRFVGRSQMNLHIEMTHIAVLRHKCDACPKAFASLVALKKHTKLVHVKNFNNLCMYCGVALADLTTLREHMRVHTGEKPYQCAHCHCAFAQRSNILSHIRSVHKEVMMTRAQSNV